MAQPIETTVARYMESFDRTCHDPAALEELLSLFASDAVVKLGLRHDPVVGFPALSAFYGVVVKGMEDSKHVWITTVLDDGRAKVLWVSAGRSNGNLTALSGIEHFTVNSDGLITNLINEMVDPGSLHAPGRPTP